MRHRSVCPLHLLGPSYPPCSQTGCLPALYPEQSNRVVDSTLIVHADQLHLIRAPPTSFLHQTCRDQGTAAHTSHVVVTESQKRKCGEDFCHLQKCIGELRGQRQVLRREKLLLALQWMSPPWRRVLDSSLLNPMGHPFSVLCVWRSGMRNCHGFHGYSGVWTW